MKPREVSPAAGWSEVPCDSYAQRTDRSEPRSVARMCAAVGATQPRRERAVVGGLQRNGGGVGGWRGAATRTMTCRTAAPREPVNAGLLLAPIDPAQHPH